MKIRHGDNLAYKFVLSTCNGGGGGGGVGWGLLVVEESDGVAGRSNLPRKVSVVFSESKF